MLTPDVRVANAKAELDAFMFANGTGDRMTYLWCRWLDEKEYEDWKDYAAEYKKLADASPNLVFKKATKSPMGFVATYKPFNCDIQFYANGHKTGWKVIIPRRRQYSVA